MVRSVHRTDPTVVERLRSDPDRPRRDAGRPRRAGAPADRGPRPRHGPARPPSADPARRRVALAGCRADAARGPDRGLPGRPAQADGGLQRGDPRPAGDVREPVGAGPAQRPAVPRARGAERRAGAGQHAQVGVPGEHVARAPDAAQRRPRLLRGAPGADVRRHQRAPGGVPPRHPRLRPAPAGAAQRDPRPVEGRGRPDGAGVLVVRPALPAGAGDVDAPGAGGAPRHRPAGRDRRRRGCGVLRRAAPQAGRCSTWSPTRSSSPATAAPSWCTPSARDRRS